MQSQRKSQKPELMYCIAGAWDGFQHCMLPKSCQEHRTEYPLSTTVWLPNQKNVVFM